MIFQGLIFSCGFLLLFFVAATILLTGVVIWGFFYHRSMVLSIRRKEALTSPATCLSVGELPHDNPDIFAGKDLAGNSQVQVQLENQKQEQDLLNYSLVVSEIKQVHGSIGERLAPFRHRFSRKKDQEEFQQVLSEIIRDTQEPMKDFEHIFRQMHGGFQERLLSAYPDLTRGELQLCALLRLNLSSKDMARITNLTVSSIDITRHRIRKKLRLEQSVSLTGHLIQY
jgi:DNA-binding CsgD family transcriptional regulator